MQRVVPFALVASALVLNCAFFVPASAEPLQLSPERYAQASRRAPAYVAPQAAPAYEVETAQPVRYAPAQPESNLGGGFIEFLFGGNNSPIAPPRPPMGVMEPADSMPPNAVYGAQPQEAALDPRRQPVDPKFTRQVVSYSGSEKAGTIIIDTPRRFLFLVQGDGTAVRYGIGVGRPGFTWAGVKSISAKKEWPDWVPPPEMLQRQPSLPAWMAGGPENPLGARAMYLGSSLYRIHGSNEPWTIGQAVSSGCIRMRNEDVIDLYSKVKLGTRVVVI